MRQAKRDDLGDFTRRAADEIAPVWVLDDPYGGHSGQAIGIAERLDVPHLRVPLTWRWTAPLVGFGGRGSLRGLAGGSGFGWPFSAPQGPALAISAGARSAAVALWLQARFGSRIVHCLPPRWGAHWGWGRSSFDLLVAPRHDNPALHPNVLPVLGVVHRFSPLMLSQARVAWAGRLAHMPRPIVALLVGGGHETNAQPGRVRAVARQVAAMASAAGGSVVASNSPQTGRQATEALAAGLSPAMNLLYRWGEPGENPYGGFLGLADAIVVTSDSVAMVCEACGSEAPVFVADCGAGRRLSRLHRSLLEAGQARPLQDGLSPWPRTPLDEAGRVAGEIRKRISLRLPGVD